MLSEFYDVLVHKKHLFDVDCHGEGHMLFNILELSKVNDKLITTIDFGSFKKSEDEGLAIRQQSSETVKFLINSN